MRTLFKICFIGLYTVALTAVYAEKVEYEHPGKFTVATLEFPNMQDSARNDRCVPIKVHYPVELGSYPLVIISHGACGTYDANIYQAQHLASHGYVVICTEHVFSNLARVRYLMSRAGGRLKFNEALVKMTKDPQAVLERPKDISFAIDTAIKWNSEHEKLKGKIDTGNIGVMGHSFGAYTTLVVCGAKLYPDYLSGQQQNDKPFDGLNDSRIKFGLAMSPQGPGTYFKNDSYQSIKIPFICISGAEDKQFNNGKLTTAENRLKVFELLPPGNKYFLLLKNAEHMGFSKGPSTLFYRIFLKSKAEADMQRISKTVMLIGCDRFLKNQREAESLLNQQFFNSISGKIVTEMQFLQK